MTVANFFKYKTIRVKQFWRKIKCAMFSNKFILWLCEQRYLKYKNLPPLKIGFLRLHNEENTVIPCLMSVDYMFDKIVLIYSEITDNSLALVHDYINKNNLQDKYVIKKYPHKVYPPHDERYFSSFFNVFNVFNPHYLSSYYRFGYNICKKLAKGRNGFLAKIDADQIYLPDCFCEIEKMMENEKFSYLVNSYGGFDGHVLGNVYKVDYSHENTGRNGFETDHIIIPFSLLNLTFYNMEIKIFPHKIAWELLHHPMLNCGIMRQYTSPMWFHFDRKKPYKAPDYKNLTAEQKYLYYKYIYPLLKKANSAYKDLIIN